MGQIFFFVLVTPFFALWTFFLFRNATPNKRWFIAYMERESSAAEQKPTIDAWFLRKSSLVPAMYRYVGYAMLRMFTGRWWPVFTGVYRPDPEPEIEVLRREAYAGLRPLLIMLSIALVVWALAMAAVLVFLAVHYFVS